MCPHCSSPQQQPRSPSLPSPPGESAVQKKLTGGGCIRPARVFTGSDFCTNKVIQSWDFEKCAWMTGPEDVDLGVHSECGDLLTLTAQLGDFKVRKKPSNTERGVQSKTGVCIDYTELFWLLIASNFGVWRQQQSSCERAFSVIDWWQTLSYCSFIVVFMHHRVLADLVPMVRVAISKAMRPIRSKKTDEWETWDDHRRRTSENRTDSKEELHCCASSSEAWRVSIHPTLQSEAFGFAQIMCQLI